jgi:glycogen(starch) synthase
MRILHLLDHAIPVHSAYSHDALSLLKQQRARGWHTIQVTGPNQGPVETADRNDDGWHWFRTAAPAASRCGLPLLADCMNAAAMAARVREVARLTRPDILHAHPPLPNAMAALRAGRRLGLPVVLQWRDARHLRGALAQFAARRADAIVVPGEGMRRELLAAGLAATRVAVVPPAISLRQIPFERTRDPALASFLGLSSGPVVGYIGALNAHSGVELLLAAMPALQRAHPGACLLVVGDGPHAGALRARAAELAIDASFTGRVERADTGRYQNLVDLLVCPRMPDRLAELEAPLKPLDAMARGAVVVASNTGGHRGLVEHGKTGILFEAGELASLVNALLSLLAEPACWDALRSGARAFVERERSYAASAARLAPVYKSLLDTVRRR